MDCHEFEKTLQVELDLRHDPRTAALEVHASECHQCSESLRSAVMLVRGVVQWRRSMPTVDLVDRIPLPMSQLVSAATSTTTSSSTAETGEASSPRFSRRLPDEYSASAPQAWARGFLALSGCALVFMFLTTAFQVDTVQSRVVKRQQRADVLTQRIARRGHPQTRSVDHSISAGVTPVEPEKAVDADLELVLVSAGEAYSRLAEQTATAANDFSLLIPPKGLFTLSGMSEERSEAVPMRTDSMLPANVYPLGDSVQDALHLLLQAVPGVEKSS
jgi:hypothetical protein